MTYTYYIIHIIMTLMSKYNINIILLRLLIIVPNINIKFLIYSSQQIQ